MSAAMNAEFLLTWNGDAFVNLLMKKAEQEMQKSGLRMASDVVRRMKTGSGRKYKSRGAQRGTRKEPIKGGPYHLASKPGQAPAPDLGELRAAVRHSVERVPGGLLLKVGVIGEKLAKRAGYLEFGAPRASILPRPSFGPAWEKEKEKLLEKLFPKAGA